MRNHSDQEACPETDEEIPRYHEYVEKRPLRVEEIRNMVTTPVS